MRMNSPAVCFERSTGLVHATCIWMMLPVMLWFIFLLKPGDSTAYFYVLGLTLAAVASALLVHWHVPTKVRLKIRPDDSFRLSSCFLFGLRSYEGRLSEIIKVRQIDTDDETFQIDMRISLINSEAFDLDVRDWQRLARRIGLTGELPRERGSGTINPSYIDASRWMTD
jgi:hypothetical protein